MKSSDATTSKRIGLATNTSNSDIDASTPERTDKKNKYQVSSGDGYVYTPERIDKDTNTQ
jgi:hypothetical protein